jgi:hypothetical protein
MGYVRRLLTSRPYKSTHLRSASLSQPAGQQGPYRGPVQLILTQLGPAAHVHRCTHTIHTTPQAAPSACTLMFNHMRCRRAPLRARPSSVLSRPFRRTAAPQASSRAQAPGARGHTGPVARLAARGPGRMQSPRACWPSGPAPAFTYYRSSPIIYFRSSVRGLRPCAL